jgi:hypothetical protein
VRIGQVKTGHDARKPDCRLQQQPSPERHTERTAKESAAECIGGIVVNQGIQESRDIRGTMLPISIKRHHVTGVLLQRKLYPGLQRGTLPQIGRVRDYSSPGGDRYVPGTVLRAIIDNNHPIASPYKVRDDRTDHCGFIKRRNNDPYRARIDFSTVL